MIGTGITLQVRGRDKVMEPLQADVDVCDVYVLILGAGMGSSRRRTTRRGCRSPTLSSATWSSAGPSSLASRGLRCCAPVFVAGQP